MRGKRVIMRPAKTRLRNIPAYAGKTAVCPLAPPPLSEHPRVCGENGEVFTLVEAKDGTSPRMRGKLPLADWFRLHPRNIPAYAGKTDAVLDIRVAY